MTFLEAIRSLLGLDCYENSAITDVFVQWDSGERYDPTYPTEDTHATLDVVIECANGMRRNVPFDVVLRNLIAVQLGLECRP